MALLFLKGGFFFQNKMNYDILEDKAFPFDGGILIFLV